MDWSVAMLMALGVTIGVATLAFWVWMIVDCARYETNEGYQKAGWLVVIVFAKLVGAIVYYLVRRAERLKATPAA